MEELFIPVARTASLLVEIAAVLIVFYGAVESFVKLLWIVVKPGVTHGERKVLWRRFGMWLLLGLEFELAADIIASVISPTWQDIGELGAIAVIRTFLNYFLEKDLEQAETTAEAIGPDEEPVVAVGPRVSARGISSMGASPDRDAGV
jgi:uncharacterized membrane protein